MTNTLSLLWWQRGVVYQIYPRSFKDTNGDGIGDLQGIIEKLDYLNDGTVNSLGVDAIWISPFYPSPMVDFGYDVADYCAIDPIFGDLATFDRLVAEAHRREMKVIVDWVPNHTSDQHPWFVASRRDRTNPKRDWYIWRDPKPAGLPPNNWGSVFGGPAWTLDETTGQYYLHQFVKEQPDLNWRNPDVQAAMMEVLRFWLRRGVDGFRMDVIGLIIKDAGLRDNPPKPEADPDLPLNNLRDRQLQRYTEDQDDVHVIIRQIRRVLDEFDERCSIGELWGPLPRWVRYYGEQGDELQLPFNFRLMEQPWQAQAIRQSVDELEGALPPFAWPNYVLGNHDRPRLASRVGGQAQARLAALLLLTLRGTPTLYYGDELGLENGVIPPEKIQDPQGKNLGAQRTRDVARTPDRSASCRFFHRRAMAADLERLCDTQYRGANAGSPLAVESLSPLAVVPAWAAGVIRRELPADRDAGARLFCVRARRRAHRRRRATQHRAQLCRRTPACYDRARWPGPDRPIDAFGS